MVGYPKSDDFLFFNTEQNKIDVCKELGFSINKPIVTYGSAGEYSFPFKQGASLSKDVLLYLKNIAKKSDFNLLIKLKHPQINILKKQLIKFKKYIST